jgi:hypothetical protein
MSFWKTSDGAAVKQANEYSSGGGAIAPIPDRTGVVIVIDEIGFSEVKGSKCVATRWSILEPQEYKNRKIWKKLWLIDTSPYIEDKELALEKQKDNWKMFTAIDHLVNGGELYAIENPTDTDLQSSLMSKPMHAIIGLVDKNDGKPNNYISQIGPVGGYYDRQKTQPQKQPTSQSQVTKPLADDHVPF